MARKRTVVWNGLIPPMLLSTTHAGAWSVTVEVVNRVAEPVPSAFIIQRFAAVFPRGLMNAIVRPSGDHAG